MEERKIMPAETVRKIAERVVLGKLFLGCLPTLSFEEGIPADILDKIERFAYGTAPDEFTPEWLEEVEALTNRIVETYPESAEYPKKAFKEIVDISNAVLESDSTQKKKG